MEIDKEKLLLSIKEALGDKGKLENALKSGNKEQIINSLPNDTKKQVNDMLNNTDDLKKLLSSKEAKDLISKFLKDK